MVTERNNVVGFNDLFQRWISRIFCRSNISFGLSSYFSYMALEKMKGFIHDAGEDVQR